MQIRCHAGNPAVKMQHWLKDLHTGGEPFSASFENMLRKSSVRQPDGKSVAESLARKEAREEAGRRSSNSSIEGSEREIGVPLHQSHSAEEKHFLPAGGRGQVDLQSLLCVIKMWHARPI